jgi:glyoxylase-like metal-dependent hydrolase (beta-lactamase superfamily II)
MPAVSLDTADAAELAELLHFLGDWLAADHDRLDASLRRFVGTAGYDVAELRRDLDRFTFLLGGDDGEALFTPGHQR